MDSKSIINIIKSAKSVRELLELLPLGSYSMESGDQCYSGTEIPIKYLCIADGSTTHRIYIAREAARVGKSNYWQLVRDPKFGVGICRCSAWSEEGEVKF